MVGNAGKTMMMIIACSASVMPRATIDAQSPVVTTRVPSAQITLTVERAPLDAVLREVARQAGLRLSYTKDIFPTGARVTARLRHSIPADAFAVILRGTGVEAVISPLGVVVLTPAEALVIQGIITGTVRDARTRRPVSGATVTVEGTRYATQTTDAGTFRMTDVPLGTTTLVIRRIGYAKVVRSVSLNDGVPITVDVVLEPSANTLDQVVVTGTLVPTELKAVPNAMTVITAKQIEERGITKIDQLFRGDIPGLFAINQGSYNSALLDEVTMFSRGATALAKESIGAANSFDPLTNAIKTYVDGIELADPKYLSQIDPKSIERIEILTGPQASTIYGSNAINGVMQIFTKRGATARPQLTLNLLSGFVQNNFSSALTPQHEYGASVSGLEGHLSYNAGGSWNYMGPWTPAKQLARTGGFGGARLELPTAAGRVTTDVTLRRTLTQSMQRGSTQHAITAFRESGWHTMSGGISSPFGLDRLTTRTLTGQTLGLSLAYVPTSWWSHELGGGSDLSDTEQRYATRAYAFGLSDTSLFLFQSHADRRSLRYATTANISLTSLARLTITAGADNWQSLTSSFRILPQTLTGT
jgi:outer membrane receptor protein involved in Fe transport